MSYLNIDPTLCRGKFTRWEDYGDDWAVELKHNGDRRLAQYCPEKTYFTGRRDGINSGNKRDISDCLPGFGEAAPSKFHGLILDGEIVVPGGNNSDVTKVVGGSATHAAAVLSRHGHPGINYHAFDILREPGRDLTLYSLDYRRKALLEWCMRLHEHGIGIHPKRKLCVTVGGRGSDAQRFYDEVLTSGGEGIVLKYRRSKYTDQRFWVKVKPWDTVTVRCIGFKMGEGKFQGLIGSLHFVDPTTGTRGSCSGMTDAERARMSFRPTDLINQMFVLRYTTVLPSGVYQNPRFQEWCNG